MKFAISLKDFGISKKENPFAAPSRNITVAMTGNAWKKADKKVPTKSELISLYRKHQKHLSKYLEGNFLIVSLDKKKRSIECFTSSEGSRFLYYGVQNQTLFCSSELNDVAVNIQNNINVKALSLYNKLNYIPAPHTVYKKIKKTESGYSRFSHNKSLFVHYSFRRQRNVKLMKVLEKTKDNIKTYCGNKPVGILCTGGLDSSLIAYMSRKLKPVLYFGAVMAPSTKEYNIYSIDKCKTIATTLGLKLRIIRLNKKDYLSSFPKAVNLLNEPLKDPDLPVVYTLYRKIKDRDKISCLLSGIGMNEIFNFPAKMYAGYFNYDVPAEIEALRRIATKFNMAFYAPFLNQEFFTYNLNTALKKRKNKAPLKELLRELQAIPAEIIDQPSRHSDIPENFLKTAKTLYSRYPRSDSFPPETKDAFLNLWIRGSLHDR